MDINAIWSNIQGNPELMALLSLIFGYVMGSIIPFTALANSFVMLIVKIPFLPVIAKVYILLFLDKLFGAIGKAIPDTQEGIIEKYFPTYNVRNEIGSKKN